MNDHGPGEDKRTWRSTASSTLRFLDKSQGQEQQLLRAYVAQWEGHLPLSTAALDVPVLKEFLANGEGDGKDAMMEGLYRAHDLSSERGHEDLIAACRDWGIDPVPGVQLPVECLSLNVLSENDQVFDLAYDRNTLWHAERFAIFRGKSAKAIPDPAGVARELQERLGEAFREEKDSDRVLVRQYREDSYVNFIVYHEQRIKAELVLIGPKGKQRVMRQIWRPAQQDFISHNHETGQVDIEARFALGSRQQPVAIDRARIDRQIRELALEHAGGLLGDDAYLTRMKALREQRDAITERTVAGLPGQRAVEWLRALSESFQAADVPKEKEELMHAIYERITVAGPEIVGVRLTQAAYAHGLALALPEKVEMARPTGVGRALATYDMRIEGRDEWLAAAGRQA